MPSDARVGEGRGGGREGGREGGGPRGRGAAREGGREGQPEREFHRDRNPRIVRGRGVGWMAQEGSRRRVVEWRPRGRVLELTNEGLVE